jgi:hypothetical protein
VAARGPVGRCQEFVEIGASSPTSGLWRLSARMTHFSGEDPAAPAATDLLPARR